ncbi:hypothetical protein L1887_45937 [Cichorium endivia]|nr:hypothetical protein L1887_45937 [Cichorium endivia]
MVKGSSGRVFHDVTLFDSHEIFLKISKLKAFTTKIGPLFGPLRILFEGFLKYADESNEYLQQHLEETRNIEPYLEAPLSIEEMVKKKGKKRKEPTDLVTHTIKEDPHAKKTKNDSAHVAISISLPFLNFLRVASCFELSMHDYLKVTCSKYLMPM